jgi:putative endonuclease
LKHQGDAAERLAEQYLIRAGLKLVTRNFRCRLGEIDLIMQDGDSLVFVEVRRRSSRGFGGAAGSIHFHKQRKLVAAAQFYLGGLGRTPPCRFDTVLLDAPDDRGASRVEWLQNAFDAV